MMSTAAKSKLPWITPRVGPFGGCLVAFWWLFGGCQKMNTAGGGRGIEVRPSRAPGMRLPLESKAISAKDADMNADSRVALPLGRRLFASKKGAERLRCVLDLHPQSMPELHRCQPKQNFEVALSYIIYRVLHLSDPALHHQRGQHQGLQRLRAEERLVRSAQVQDLNPLPSYVLASEKAYFMLFPGALASTAARCARARRRRSTPGPTTAPASTSASSSASQRPRCLAAWSSV